MPTANVRYLEDDNGNVFFPVTHQDAVLDNDNNSLSTILDGKADIFTGTTDYWDSLSGYIPPAGTIIIYNDHSTKEVDGNTVDVPAMKIGSGNAYVQDLAFVNEDIYDDLSEHIANGTIHVTAADKAKWNNKLNVNDNMEVVNGSLIFNRD